MKKINMKSGNAVGSTKHNSELRVAKSVYRKGATNQLQKVFSYILLGLLIVYVCFSLTIMRVIPTSTNIGFIPVKNNTYPGGIIPSGATIVMDKASEQGDGIIDHFRQSVLPSENVVLVKVISGPYGKVSWNPNGIISVDGKLSPVKVKDRPDNNLLENEYLVQCVKGNCSPGEGMIIPSKNIYGQPLLNNKEK